MISDNDGPIQNTDREIWRERDGDYRVGLGLPRGDFYRGRIFVTESGGIGIDVGGNVIVKPLKEWHSLAAQSFGENAWRDKNITAGELADILDAALGADGYNLVVRHTR